MSDLAKIKAVPDKGVFHLNLITKLLNVSENDGMIGVIGVNWLTTVARHAKYVDNVFYLLRDLRRMDIISHHKII
jgi:phosphate transport system substrate-binding protein